MWGELHKCLFTYTNLFSTASKSTPEIKPLIYDRISFPLCRRTTTRSAHFVRTYEAVVLAPCNCTYLVFRSLEEVRILEVVEIRSGKHSRSQSGNIVLKLKLESSYCCLSAHYSTTFLDLRFLLPGTQP